jgi:hypothetical protein
LEVSMNLAKILNPVRVRLKSSHNLLVQKDDE